MSKLERVRSEIASYDYIRFAISDINGTCRGQVVPSRNAVKYLEGGADMYEGALMLSLESEMAIIPHEKCYHYGNMTLVPDLDTLRPIPWGGDGKAKVAEISCECRWKIDNSPQEACPRYVLRQQIQRLDELGLDLYSGFEIEYFLFYADTMKPVFSGKDFMSHRIQNQTGPLLFKFDGELFKAGIDVDKIHSEYAPGMFEAVMKPQYGIEGADATFNLKQGLLELADLNGLKATFMSKLDLEQTGCGAHFNFSLVSKDTRENAFYDQKESDSLSTTAKQWIAGILKHSRALTALTSPTINCYRRLHQPWAPGSIFWGIEDREASLRVKNHGPSGTYLENRMPSGRSNPYIVMAATIAAGLDGVKNKLVCPPSASLKEGEPLPFTLDEALKDLQADRDLVKTLGEEFVSWFVKCKELDLKRFAGLADDKERMALEKKIYF
ncbi:lengsin-like isoform X2 [Haliotis rubra]|uniref:lengsin-like isoform X2 n=1 Tax=Haliotis rubra TaxID=36100 RepID=UPI001EE5FF5A|nr:lengsin-like isoform X2 [Haliotis rubra]